jgi:hypothetical protein
MEFNKISYDKEYSRQNYDKIAFYVPKGKRQIVKDYAETRGESVNQIMIAAVED